MRCASSWTVAALSVLLPAACGGGGDATWPVAPALVPTDELAGGVAASAVPYAVFRTTPAADAEGAIVGQTPLEVRFNMCPSRPEDEQDDLRYTFDFDGDGAVDFFGHCRAQHVYKTSRQARSCTTARMCVGDRRPDGEVCRQYQVCVEGGPEGGSPAPASLTSTTTFASTDIPRTIPDVATVTSANTVSGIGAITHVTVSFHLTHTFDNDLDLFLIAPDGTAVELSTDNGGSGNDFGTSCGNRVTFDDTAATPITAGVAPFAGTFRPEGSLAALNGKAGAAANGTWQLRITDDLGGDIGTLLCWSLTITHVN